VIEIEGLSFSYSTGGFCLAVGSLSLPAGARAAVIGSSGCGKTTLLHLVAGVVTPQAGRIRVDGTEVSALPDARRREFRIKNVGMVFQEFELVEHLTVLDNILLPCRISRAVDLDPDRAAALAAELGLGDKLQRFPRRLSQGERQRVAVCRALLTRPPLVLADEPTGNLDPDNTARVLDALLGYSDETGATLLTVTHDHGLLDRFDTVLDAEAWA